MANVRTSAGINDKGGKNVNPINKAINTVTSYVGNVAREVRDIPTAISTAYEYRNNENGGSYSDLKKDIGTQVKEVGKMALTGKKGTRATVHQDGVLTRNPKRK